MENKKMDKHREQRVSVFVDVGNLYHSAKNLFNARVSFNRILETAVSNRKLIRAIAYVITSQTEEEGHFFDALSSQGFELKAKELQIFPGGMKKGDWDVGIAVDAIKMADKLDTIVLVSGDGDYLPLVNYLRENKGCRIEVMAFGESASHRLIDEADEFVNLSKDKKRFLIKK
jgi:uncharacterized LabA/DUF88 family protein